MTEIPWPEFTPNSKKKQLLTILSLKIPSSFSTNPNFFGDKTMSIQLVYTYVVLAQEITALKSIYILGGFFPSPRMQSWQIKGPHPRYIMSISDLIHQHVAKPNKNITYRFFPLQKM